MSLRQSINAKCRECIYDKNSQGTWRKQVSECASKACPLHKVRPTQVIAKTPGENE